MSFSKQAFFTFTKAIKIALFITMLFTFSYLLNTNLNLNQYIKWIFIIFMIVSLLHPIFTFITEDYIAIFELIRFKIIALNYYVISLLTFNKQKKIKLNEVIILYEKEVKDLRRLLNISFRIIVRCWKQYLNSKYCWILFLILLFLRIYLWWFLFFLTIFYLKLILDEFKLFHNDTNNERWTPECTRPTSHTPWNDKYVNLTWFVYCRHYEGEVGETEAVINAIWHCFITLTFNYQCKKAFLLVYSGTKFFYKKRFVNSNESYYMAILTSVYSIIRLVFFYILRVVGLPLKMSLEMFDVAHSLAYIPGRIKNRGDINKHLVYHALRSISGSTSSQNSILQYAIYRDKLDLSIIVWNPTEQVKSLVNKK